MSVRGRIVLVTRSPTQAPELVAALVERGAAVVALPTLIIAAPTAAEPLTRAARDGGYDWVVFSSHNAVERFFTVADVRTGGARWAAVGPKTAHALARHIGEAPVVVPAQHEARALLEVLPEDLSGQRILLPRAPEGRAELLDGLRARGALVDAPEAYRLCFPEPASETERQAAERAHIATFLSGRTLEGFLQVMGEGRARALLDRCVVAVIGPVAAAAAAALGIRVDLVPPAASIESLVEALDKA